MTAELGHSIRSVWARLATLIVGVLALAGCQLDVVADVVVEPDGTGTVTVTADADSELVAEVPTIADDLVLDDIVAAGWTVEGPTDTPDGGLTLVLTQDFDGADEATNLLRSLGPPFNDPVVSRGQNGDTATNTARANLGLPNGFASFADDDLVAAVGGVPFQDRFDQDDVDPIDSFTAILRISAPGEPVESETNGELGNGGSLQWNVPLDGSILEASLRTEQAPSEGGAWARPVSIIALVALVGWVSFMTIFILYVTIARWRRARRYRRRALP